MEDLLFILCISVIVWGLPRAGFIKKSGLSLKEAQLLLMFKLVTGITLAVCFKHFTPNIDYIHINDQGFEHYQLLIDQPSHFFDDLSNDLQQYGTGGVFETKNSFWGYLRFTLLYKLMAIVNLLTKGNFIYNTALFSIFVFIGHIAFFRIYYSIYPKYKWLVMIASFCLPSVVVYTACIHKDGIIFVCLGLFSYLVYQFVTRSFIWKWYHVVAAIGSLVAIALFRNYVLVALLPALMIPIIAQRTRIKKRFVFAGCYIVFVTCFFLTGLFNNSFNLPAAVVQRKADFAQLETGTTTIPMNALQPNTVSFATNLPQAVNHFLFRPYLWEFSQPAVLLTALELLIYQVLIVLSFVYRRKTLPNIHPFNIFGLALFLNMMLIIGYTIPNIGAIVRYRSIFWIFILCPLLSNIDWKRLLGRS